VKIGADENTRDQDTLIEASTIFELQVERQDDANGLIDSRSAANVELTG